MNRKARRAKTDQHKETYSVEVEGELEIPALLTNRLPVCLLHQFVVQIHRRHCLIWWYNHVHRPFSIQYGIRQAHSAWPSLRG